MHFLEQLRQALRRSFDQRLPALGIGLGGIARCPGGVVVLHGPAQFGAFAVAQNGKTLGPRGGGGGKILRPRHLHLLRGQMQQHGGFDLARVDTKAVLMGAEGRVYLLRQRQIEPAAVDHQQAMLLAQLPLAWDEHRQPLLEAYAAGGGASSGDDLRLAQEVHRSREWRLKDYLGKTLRDCTLFSVSRSALRFCAVLREARDELWPLLDAPDEAIRQGKMLKDGRTCTVAQVGEDERKVVIKRYNLKSLGHALQRFWRPSRAWHSWREGHRLLFFGLATPKPLALIEERIGPLRRRAFLLNEFCPGLSLMQCLSADREPAAEMASAIIGLFETLNRLRISHGDMKATNLLWHEGRIVLIDLDAVEQHRSARSYARAWRRDRARLLRNWPESSVLQQWLDRNLPVASS